MTIRCCFSLWHKRAFHCCNHHESFNIRCFQEAIIMMWHISSYLINDAKRLKIPKVFMGILSAFFFSSLHFFISSLSTSLLSILACYNASILICFMFLYMAFGLSHYLFCSPSICMRVFRLSLNNWLSPGTQIKKKQQQSNMCVFFPAVFGVEDNLAT